MAARRDHLSVVPTPVICPVCDHQVLTGDDMHYHCRSTLQPVQLRLTGPTCSVCARPIDHGMKRCDSCPAPALPQSYLDAKARLDENLAGRRRS